MLTLVLIFGLGILAGCVSVNVGEHNKAESGWEAVEDHQVSTDTISEVSNRASLVDKSKQQKVLHKRSDTELNKEK